MKRPSKRTGQWTSDADVVKPDKKAIRCSRKACFVLALTAGAALLGMLVPLPGRTLFWSALQNAGHALLFTCLTLGTLMIWPGRHAIFTRKAALTTAALMFSFGAIAEALQSLTGRSVSMTDLVLNSAGITAALLMFTGLRRSKSSGTASRCGMIAGGAGILLICFWPPAQHAMALLLRSPLPTINDFDRPFARLFVQANKHTQTDIVPAPVFWTGSGNRVLQVEFNTGPYPGYSLLEPHADWRPYDRLVFSAFVPGDSPQQITLRIHDRAHDFSYHDRFNRRLTLNPGLNERTIELLDVRCLGDSFNGHREMDMANVAGLMMFKYQAETPVTLYFDNVRLERSVLSRQNSSTKGTC